MRPQELFGDHLSGPRPPVEKHYLVYICVDPICLILFHEVPERLENILFNSGIQKQCSLVITGFVVVGFVVVGLVVVALVVVTVVVAFVVVAAAKPSRYKLVSHSQTGELTV